MPLLVQQPAPPVLVLRLPAGKPDACCAPGKKSAAPLPPVLRRAKLSDLDGNVHCSIIGTCLGTGELRKFVPRYDPGIDRKMASDLEIHHAAVNLSTTNDAVARELSKALDTRHAGTIRRFKAALSEAALGALWREAVAGGDVPGAYWALMTHPLSTFALRTEAFGDVHMLSHLVGASNRADIRRLAALEEECARLRSQVVQQQGRINALDTRLQQASACAEERGTQLASLRERLVLFESQDAARELEQARACLAAQREQVALLTGRCAAAEERLAASVATVDILRAERTGMQAEASVAQAEIEMLEGALDHALGGDPARSALPSLAGMTIAYIGGRQQATLILARLVADAGGELVLHDGGIEDRKGLLPSTLARAQLVVYPVDCISHNAMHVAKQAAARSGIPCHPLRKSSVASFAQLMQRVCATVPEADMGASGR